MLEIFFVKSMRNKFKKKFCIVGIGKHAYDNIIPALEKKNYNILGLVSRKPKIFNRKYRVFKNLDLAIKNLHADTIFVLCTPPRTHFDLIKKLVKNKKNVLVEKPICVNQLQVKNLFHLFLRKNFFFYEMYMCQFTYSYKRALNYVINHYSRIKGIEFKFCLPSYPDNTFRNSKNFYDNCLYDIGCYIINFTLNINNKIRHVKLIDLSYNKETVSNIIFSFALNHIQVKASIGLSKKYENYIKFKEYSGNEIFFDKVFYGKSVNKEIRNYNLKSKSHFTDVNGYETMFKELNFEKIIKYKLPNYIKLKETYEVFDNLKKIIEKQ